MSQKVKPLIPIGASQISLFDIKKNNEGIYEGFIGFYINGNFNFIQIEVDDYVLNRY